MDYKALLDEVPEQKTSLKQFESDVNIFFEKVKNLNYHDLQISLLEEPSQALDVAEDSEDVEVNEDVVFIGQFHETDDYFSGESSKHTSEISRQEQKVYTENTSYYKIELPTVLLDEYRDLVTKITDFKHPPYEQEFKEIMCLILFDFRVDTNSDDLEVDYLNFKTLQWEIDIELLCNNRIHIHSEHIPPSFRKKGLGPKIYKKVMSHADIIFISSTTDKSNFYSRNIWSSLMNDKEVSIKFKNNFITATLA